LIAPLPFGVEVQTSNNCLGIIYFEGRLFLGWRSAPFHFASPLTKIYIISSENNGTKSWDLEYILFMGSDMREPFFVI